MRKMDPMSSEVPALDLGEKRSSTAKVMDILKVLAEDPLGAVGVTELASRAQLSKSTVHRILQELLAADSVEQVENQYILAPWLVSQLNPRDTNRSRELRELLTPFLGQIYALTQQTTHLAVLNGLEVLYLNKLTGRDPLASPSRAGGRAPTYCTGVGKVLLAYNPNAANAVLNSHLIPWTPHTITSPEQLKAELVEIRETGFGYDREEIRPGLTCIAAPIHGKQSTVAALSISGEAGKFNHAEYAGVLESVCAAASRALKI